MRNYEKKEIKKYEEIENGIICDICNKQILGEEYKCIDDIQEIKQRTVYLCDDFEDIDDDEWDKLLELIKEER